ncbi:uncharacterized protein L201_001875 [Kwoniella dendrophila CBS 6074]|uniref:Uncharacterized protein n=1 Tax=Kwoniella dendrophila CBS 6074 TaxID=1295534 RepID=A0AAX4JQ46_9TREE
MSMFSSFSFKSLDDSPQPRNRLSSISSTHSNPFLEEDDHEQDQESFYQSSGLGSGRQSRSSLSALAEDVEEEEQGQINTKLKRRPV